MSWSGDARGSRLARTLGSALTAFRDPPTPQRQRWDTPPDSSRFLAVPKMLPQRLTGSLPADTRVFFRNRRRTLWMLLGSNWARDAVGSKLPAAVTKNEDSGTSAGPSSAKEGIGHGTRRRAQA